MLRRRRSTAPESNGRRRRIRKLRLAALLLILFLLSTASFTFGLITAVASQIPNCDPARVDREVDGHIYANDNHTILTTLRGSESRILVETEEIHPIMQQAIVAIEDKRFYQHRGIDLRGIARAVWADVRSKRVVQGGSTITQQFIKNSCVNLTARTISRKLKEAALAWQLEQRWSKDRILTAYLNTIYFGNGAYGIQRAAQTYFHTTAAKLTLPQAALLAGIPADPSRYDPVTNPKTARARRLEVLNAMLAQHTISAADLRRAAGAPLPRPEDVRLPGIQGPAPYFVNYVKQQLIEKYGTRKVFGGGLEVQTTIDLRLQKFARRAIEAVLKEPGGPSAALVAVRPRTGEILAMYGGNFRQSQFNLAVQGERQPGSSFKPFVLATALKQGIAPSTTFASRPISIFMGDRYWPVTNYEDHYLGSADLATATVASDNSVYAQLTRLVGPANVARTARQLGVTRKLDPYFAIGLGADPVSPLEMARAFSTFANEGRRVDGAVFGNRPRAIARIRDVEGKLADDNRPINRAVLTRDQSALLTSILEDVVRSGTGQRARLSDRTSAGKTGTTENYGDAWFVGYTPQLATAVWVGYPNKLVPMLTEYHGEPVAGGTFPAEIWRVFNQMALAGTEPESFPTYSYHYATSRRVVWRDGRVQLDNGRCRGATLVSYFSGRGPKSTANCKLNEVDVPRVIGMKIRGAQIRLAAQPLTANIVYKPAKPKQRLDLVVDQFPRKGRLSSYDTVTLVVAKPLHGVVPKVVGLSLREARRRLRVRGFVPAIERFAQGQVGHVLAQLPVGGVAGAPRLRVRLVVGRD